MHLLKQGAKPVKPRKERKTFAAAEFVPPQEEEEEKKKPEEEEVIPPANDEEEWVDDGMEVVYQDAEKQARHSKRNKSKPQPK